MRRQTAENPCKGFGSGWDCLGPEGEGEEKGGQKEGLWECQRAKILDAKAGGRGPGGCCLLYMCRFVGECAYFKWHNNIDPATNVN